MFCTDPQRRPSPGIRDETAFVLLALGTPSLPRETEPRPEDPGQEEAAAAAQGGEAARGFKQGLPLWCACTVLSSGEGISSVQEIQV